MSNRELTTSIDTLFPQQQSNKCRVCNREVVDGRWNYCSNRCRENANAFARMYNWHTVREAILERDDYTCQNCGLSKEMWINVSVKGNITTDVEKWATSESDIKKLKKEQIKGLFHVDHIEPIADDGHPFDEENLQTLCKWCHYDKTSTENSESNKNKEQNLTLDDYIE